MTLVGWLIAIAVPSWRPRAAGWMLAVAAVAMLLVSAWEMLPGAWRVLGTSPLVLWVGAGVLVVLALRLAARAMSPAGSDLQRSAAIVAIALAIHNIPEGAAPYAAALLSLQGGLVVAFSIGLHNIAEGLAIATPVLAGGGSRARAWWLTVVATAGELLGALIAFSVSSGVSASLAGGLVAFVAGVMITVSLIELLPASLRLLRTSGEIPTAGSVPAQRLAEESGDGRHAGLVRVERDGLAVQRITGDGPADPRVG